MVFNTPFILGTDFITIHPVALGNPLPRRLVLIDTPGFGDKARKHRDILMLISSWAEQNGSGHGTGNHAKLAGLIYVDRINKPRFGASAKSVIGLVERICGSDNFSNLVLVTTHWDAESAGKAMEREHDLKTKKDFGAT